MNAPDDQELAQARRARLIGIVIAGTAILWLAFQWLAFGLSARIALLVDFAAMAAFVWALVNVYWLWRARREE